MTYGTGQPEVLALVRDRGAAARVADALRPGVPGAPPQAGAAVRCVTRVHDFVQALAARAWALVVVEAFDVDGVATEEAVRTLRARYPELPVLGHATARAGLSGEVLALARAGVHELVVAGIDDVGTALRAALARASRRSSADRILAAVLDALPPAAVPLVRYCLEHGATAPTVPEVARALGVSRQTLAARLRGAGLPAPRVVAAWCRLLLAADLLAAGRSVDQVALTLDFPSANGFRNVLRRHTGLGPAALRRVGAAGLLGAFRAALAPAAGDRAAARPARGADRDAGGAAARPAPLPQPAPVAASVA